MSKNTLREIFQVAWFGPFTVYVRGRWARKEHLPRYMVELDGRNQKEFRRKQPAINWARNQSFLPR